MRKIGKILSAMLTAVMLLSLFAIPAVVHAESGVCGDNLTWTFDNGVLTISGEGEMEDYYGFSPVNLPPWTELPVASIVVEEGVTSLGVNAFSYFKDDAVTSISLPASLTDIGKDALLRRLGVISIAEGSETFRISGDCLIKNNSQIVLGCSTSVIPADGSIKSIGEGAFAGCDGLTELVLPDGLVTVADAAFRNCRNLVSVTLPEGMNAIGAEAFQDCTGLKSINLPDGLKYIFYDAFAGCFSLESVTVPVSVRELTPGTFSTRTTLKVYANSFAHIYADYYGYEYELIGTIGDVDGDGEITVSDALAALRVAAKLVEADDGMIAEMDFDFNGRVDVEDALAILRKAAKLA